MDNYLAALTELRKGDSLSGALTAERLNAMQMLIKGLWRGDNVRILGFSKAGNSGGGVSFRPGRGRNVVGEVRKVSPLEIRDSQPSYIKASSGAVSESQRRYYVEWGSVNGVIADNWDSHFDLNSSTYFFAKATFANSDDLKVASWTIETGSDYDSHETPEWGAGAIRPDYAIALLGQVYVDNAGSHHILPDALGSIQFTEHVVNIQSGGSSGTISLRKQISYHRLTF